MSELIDSLFQDIENKLKSEPIAEAYDVLYKDNQQLGFMNSVNLRKLQIQQVEARYDAQAKAILNTKNSIIPVLKQKLATYKEYKKVFSMKLLKYLNIYSFDSSLITQFESHAERVASTQTENIICSAIVDIKKCSDTFQTNTATVYSLSEKDKFEQRSNT